MKDYNADLYDLKHEVELQNSTPTDVQFYLQCCRNTNGKILELGCGTGRVLLPIAREGLKITGLDLSENMLSKCKSKLAKESSDLQKRVKLIKGSMVDFSLDEQFDMIIIPFRGFMHLITIADQLSCLFHIREHLAPKGKFIFDVFAVDMKGMSELSDGVERVVFSELLLPGGRKVKHSYRHKAQHPSKQYNDVELIYSIKDKDGKTEKFIESFPWRYYFNFEIEHLLALAGFEIIDFYGDFDKLSFIDNSPEMIFINKIRKSKKEFYIE